MSGKLLVLFSDQWPIITNRAMEQLKLLRVRALIQTSPQVHTVIRTQFLLTKLRKL